jgi:indole-3-glycerol phosphate synthase
VILDEILAHKRAEVAAQKAQRPLAELERELASRHPYASGTGSLNVAVHGVPHVARVVPIDAFELSLRQPGVSFIAEIKRKSPSAGELRPGASASQLAEMYAAAGARALSVLTDARFFGGSDADLVDARRASGLAVLRKDFVVDPYQIYEAAAIGADAVLLIVRALSDAELKAMLDLTEGLGMAVLVETHSADEVQRALKAGARIIGVNNRDLDTLTTDVSLAPRLRPLVPPECVFVAESGISTPEQISVLLEAGVDAVLIGEALLREADPGAKLRALVAAGAPKGLRV